MRSGTLTVATLLHLLLAAACAQAADLAGANGLQLYRRACASCHGNSGRGDGPDAPLYVEKPRDLRQGFLGRYATEELVRRIREGRALRLELDPQALRERALEVEAVVAYMQALPRIDWAAANRGWEIYVERCETCHGIYGKPPDSPPPGVRRPRNLADAKVQRSLGDADLITAVRHGRQGMPALAPQVTEAESLPLAAFVRLLSPGFELYTQYCAACHGDGGLGVGSYGDAIHRPAVVFNRAYLARAGTEKLRESVWHMLDDHKPTMPHFRWSLSEAECRQIVEHLKSLP